MNAVSTIRRRSARLGAAAASLAAISAIALTACSVEDTLPMPSCTQDGTTSLGAQAVPTAELVPCLEPLPEGWEADNVRVDQDGMEVRFDSDRAGDNAAVFHYTAECDIGDAVSTPSEQEGAERYEYVERIAPSFRAQRFYVFEGGCIWWEFDFDPDATASLAIDLGDRLQTITRETLIEMVREQFIDVDL